jgi:hypothetical protein
MARLRSWTARRRARIRAGAGASLVGAACVVTGCGEPTRPFVPGNGTGGPDTFPPTIEFLAPSADTTVSPGAIVVVQLRVSDRSDIASVVATVTGAVNFGFPQINPLDTVFQAGFPIPTDSASLGVVRFTVLAADVLANSAEDTLAFAVQ